MKKIALILSLFALVGCYREKKSSDPLTHLGGDKVLMQIICCDPAATKPGNADKCAALKPLQAPNDAMVFAGVLTTMTTSAASCINLDETPFWGETK